MSLRLLLRGTPVGSRVSTLAGARLHTANTWLAKPQNLRVGSLALLGELRQVTARRISTSSQARAPQPTKKPLYPERLLIYHPGTGRITFLACLKLTTIFTFTFFGVLFTPAYLSADEPLWKAAGIFLCGLAPLLIVAYTTGPYVTFIHAHLPPFARGSRDLLLRWARSAPPGARLDVTTMSPIGKPRVTSVALGDLVPRRARLGLVTHARDTAADNASRPWWRHRAVARFNISPAAADDSRDVPAAWVWRQMAAGLERRAERGR